MKKTVYGIYDEFEECRFVGTIGEITKEFNCDKSTISKAISRKTMFKGKYSVVAVYEEG